MQENRDPRQVKKHSLLYYHSNTIILLAIAACIVLVLVFAFVKLSGDKTEKPASAVQNENTLSGEAESQKEDQAEESVSGTTETGTSEVENVSAIGELAPEAGDGSGAAGIMKVPEDMLAEAAQTGWHNNDNSIWYSMEGNWCYYNGWQEIDGSKYHFNQSGRLDLGWHLIGGQSCYFDDQGVYCPDKDNSKMLAFTFDDGPSEGMDFILDLCEETGARVTFFMIGVQVENGGAVLPKIVRNRCEVGNHSYTHANKDGMSVEECKADFDQCDEFIKSFNNGVDSTVVRFPYGNYTSEQTAAVGKPNIFWNIDSLDWESQDAESIKSIVYEQITDGDIILMHDRYDATVEACRELFPTLIAQGYQIVTISELAAAKGVSLEGGATYFDFCEESLANGSAFTY